MEKLATAPLSLPVRTRLRGECLFIRSYCYFYLVNLFGDVPLVLHTDYLVNMKLPRAPVNEVYDQMVTDLKEAQLDLPTNYPSAERTRPNKWAATALLARIDLYRQQWSQAETESSSVIASGTYSLVSNLNSVFLKGSQEAIWQEMTVTPNYNTGEGNLILPTSSAVTPTFLFTPALMSAFETGDNRKTAWVASRTFANTTLYYPYKYKSPIGVTTVTEYYTALRLAEQYLIRAEARAQQDNIAGAKTDLNLIRTRAGLPGTTAADKASMLAAIARERRIELMAEWGHRWLDLKRRGEANAVIGALKPATWQPTDVLWPIPYSELNANAALTQNPGY